MKTLFFLLAFSTFSFAQKAIAIPLPAIENQCTVKISVAQLTSKNLDFKCSESNKNEILKVENFKIKFKGNPTVAVQGSSLNDAAKELASISKAGDRVYIFDIENSNLGKKVTQKYSSIYISIID